MRESLNNRWRKLLAVLASTVVLVAVAAGIAAAAPAGGSSNADALAYARAQLTACTAAQNAAKDAIAKAYFAECVAEAQAEIAALAVTSPSPTRTTGAPTPSATVSPTGAPTPSPTATGSPTPTPTGPVVGDCPTLPAMPDASCTGWQHTGVTLRPSTDPYCALPLTHDVDGCDFPAGEVNVSAANLHVSRSRIHGAVVYRSADDGSLRGLTLTDVEIDSSNALGTSSIGNNDWTCIRCNVHGGTRGANPGHNVLLRDSWLHGWTSRSGDHITGVGSNGGSDVVIDHNNISCDILNDTTGFACSSGLSVYGDDSPGNARWTITNNLINSGSSYCVIIAGPPSKPYPFLAMTFAGNVFGADGARARGLADDRCTEFGPVTTQPGSWGTQMAPVNGNIWANNVTLAGTAVPPQ